MSLELSPLTAVSPVDGRYHGKTAVLADYFSEYATIRYRVMVEVEYFIALCKAGIEGLPCLDDEMTGRLRQIYSPEVFTVSEAGKVKLTERTTNHDVKAVEYYIKDRFDALGLSRYKEFIHFGLTSQDINNTAFPRMLNDAVKEVIIPLCDKLAAKTGRLAEDYKTVSMLARTHGQPASPTTLGKELFVFCYRLGVQLKHFREIVTGAKFGGATGNMNAHYIAYPEVEWGKFATEFVESLGLWREQVTTQISNYDNLAEICQGLERINTIILDLDRDIWSYISMGYFKQKIKEGEVGSSAMPHKVNPIDFENSEGNLGIANAILGHLASKLPVSRLQRDLTDSTVIRNLGVPLAHMVIALESTLKGLDKLIVDTNVIAADLDNNWAVVAEAIQTVLRREGYPKPYEALKALTRTNKHIDRQAISDFIDNLEGIDEDVRAYLHGISPESYIGNADKFCVSDNN